jgi:hypothetical protein
MALVVKVNGARSGTFTQSDRVQLGARVHGRN